ncbi:phage tail length tape measure family protein [Sinorhizobium meliloti]|uniref:phage tail length tape measure family protein n=1 Tax=Rhizobium meliloti TaxID=382 RepID=UPI0012950B13|nr:phage tail length tape measure family protein [Sinorhizobium meliloti]MQX33289.1 phage tail protein [Sinorhizobium meliloti]
MATPEETKLVLQIEANIKALENALKKSGQMFGQLERVANDNVGSIGRNVDRQAQQIRKSMQSASGDVRNLQFQLNDIATGLMSGQSPFTIMAQQSGQLSQALSGAGGLRGAVSLIGSAVGGLINPVNLVLAGLAAATFALQAYFDDSEADADEANKALQEHAKLLSEIKERWGETIPEVAEYVSEIERATESLKKHQDLKTIVTDIFKPATAAVAATEDEVLDLQSRLSAIGKADLGSQIAKSFAKVKTEVAANRYPLQELVNLQNLVLQAFALQVTGAKDLADTINREIVPALRNANTEASEMTRSFGEMPRSLAGAGPPPLGIGLQIRQGEQERFEEALGDAADAIDRFVDNVIQAEGPRGGPNLAGASSAHGYGQFINSTWLEVFRRNFAREAAGMSDAAILALRDDLETNRRMIRVYASENAKALIDAGVTINEAALQLAHFLGAGGAIKVLKSAPGTKIADIPGMEDAIAANPKQLGGGATREDVLAYAERRTRANRDVKRSLDDVILSERQSLELQQQINAINADASLDDERRQFAIDKLTASTKLLNQAKAAGVTLGPAELAAIEAQATAYAQAERAQRQMTEARKDDLKRIEDQTRAQEQYAAIAKTAFSGFVNDLRNGVDAGEAFLNSLNRVIDGLINMTIEAMFAKNALGGLFGGLGGIFGGGQFGIAAGGGIGLYHGGGIVGQSNVPKRNVNPLMFANAPRLHNGLLPGEFPAILQRGEMVIPKNMRGGSAPVVDRSTVNLGDVSVDVSTGAVVATSDEGKELGLKINKVVQAVLVAESRPGGILRRVPQ